LALPKALAVSTTGRHVLPGAAIGKITLIENRVAVNVKVAK